MNISVTIPQLFYDLIARAIPGSLFLLMSGLVLLGVKNDLLTSASLTGSSVVVIILAMGFIVLAYMVGWVLHAFTFQSYSSRTRTRYETDKTALSIAEKYNWIRIKNEVVGFRITKLRAEARMLETSRSGMTYVFLLAVGLILLNKLASFQMEGQSDFLWGIKLGLPLILAIGFRKLEKRSWDKYYANVTSHYQILFNIPAARPGSSAGKVPTTRNKKRR